LQGLKLKANPELSASIEPFIKCSVILRVKLTDDARWDSVKKKNGDEEMDQMTSKHANWHHPLTHPVTYW
jgi:hypothetical protein